MTFLTGVHQHNTARLGREIGSHFMIYILRGRSIPDLRMIYHNSCPVGAFTICMMFPRLDLPNQAEILHNNLTAAGNELDGLQ